MRHHRAFVEEPENERTLDVGGQYQWRQDGEYHLNNPADHPQAPAAARTNDYKVYKEYAEYINTQSKKLATIRGGCWSSTSPERPYPSKRSNRSRSICKRFKSGGMSYGSISKEAHEALAIAMNRLGGKSNTGEGGEDPARYVLEPNGDSKNSAIKQVASARFGVTSYYLVNARELQIKMAQGAKPGEGGELPSQGIPMDRQGPARDPRRRAHLSSSSPRHILDRGPRSS